MRFRSTTRILFICSLLQSSLLSAGSIARAADDSSPKALQFKSITAGAIAVSQDSGQTYSGFIQYSPRYRWNKDWTLALALGIAPLRSNEGSVFSLLESVLQVRRKISDEFSIAPLIGIQKFNCTRCSTPMTAGLAGLYQLGMLDLEHLSLVGSYNSTFESQPAHQFRLGLQFDW